MVALRATVAFFFWLITTIIFERINQLLCFTNIYFQLICMQTFRVFEAEKKNLPASHQNPAAFHAVAVFTLNDGRMESSEEFAAEESPVKIEGGHENSLPLMDQPEMSEQPSSPNETMSSAEVLRNSITPLGMNNSLNIQRNETDSGNLAAGMSSFIQHNNTHERVPLDRPLFINTAMTAQQRIDIYRRLSGPPQDNEPALIFRWP